MTKSLVELSIPREALNLELRLRVKILDLVQLYAWLKKLKVQGSYPRLG